MVSQKVFSSLWIKISSNASWVLSMQTVMAGPHHNCKTSFTCTKPKWLWVFGLEIDGSYIWPEIAFVIALLKINLKNGDLASSNLHPVNRKYMWNNFCYHDTTHCRYDNMIQTNNIVINHNLRFARIALYSCTTKLSQNVEK